MYKHGSLWLPLDSEAYKHVSGSSKTMMGWNLPRVTDTDNHLLPALGALQATSTDLQRNDPLAGGFIRNLVNGTISLGLQPEPVIEREFLGISQEKADKFINDAEFLWGLYARSFDSDFSRKKTFWGLEKQTAYSKVLFGNVYGIKKWRDGSVFGTCIQLVEDHRVETPPDKLSDESIVDGIETDENSGETIAIWVRNKQKKDEADEKHERVPVYDKNGFRQLMHIKRDDERIGGTKGVPLLNNITTLLKQTGRYTEAEAEASVINAFIAFYTTTEGAVGPGTALAQNRGVVNNSPAKAAHEIPREIRSGQTYNMGPGGKINSLTPGRPNPAAETFMMAMIKFMACYLQIPYEVLLGVYHSSYSASRASIMQAYRLYQKERQDLASEFHNHVWEWFVSECVAKGLLEAPGFFENPLIRQTWLQVEWMGDSPPQLDLWKEAKGATEFIRARLAPRKHFSRTILGLRYDRVQEQLEREERNLKKEDIRKNQDEELSKEEEDELESD